MAIYSWQAPDLEARGPTLSAYVAVSSQMEWWLRRASLPIPVPVPVTALLDTGAFSSAIDNATVQHLGLRPVGAAIINSPVEREPIVTPKYQVRIMVPNLITFETTVIQGRADAEVNAVLGRDLLAGAVFVYVGY